MPCVGFEPTIPAPERAKTVHALDRGAIVIGGHTPLAYNLMCFYDDSPGAEIFLIYVEYKCIL
jgi:hypothetical protein